MLAAGGRRDRGRAHDRALAARLRLRHHPRRRARGRSLRGADAEAQADRDHGVRRADGHGGRAVPLLHRLSRAVSAFGLAYAVNSIAMPMIGGTTTGRPAGRRGAARHNPAGRDRDDLVGGQPADRRPPAGRLCHRRAERLVGLFKHLRASDEMQAAAARGRSSGQTFRRLRRARRDRARRRAGRAARPDRSQRLGQVDAGQLHLRDAAQRNRHRAVRRPAIAGCATHQRTRLGIAR